MSDKLDWGQEEPEIIPSQYLTDEDGDGKKVKRIVESPLETLTWYLLVGAMVSLPILFLCPIIAAVVAFLL